MKKPKLYATFSMAGFEIPVSIGPAKVMDAENELGCAYGGKSPPAIFIHEELKGEKFENTLLHEMLHVAADCSGITLTERQVEGLTGMLRQAFKSFKKKGKK